jgi:hypothetical protein
MIRVFLSFSPKRTPILRTDRIADKVLAFSKTLQQVQVLDGGMLAKMLEKGVKEDPWSSVARLEKPKE